MSALQHVQKKLTLKVSCFNLLKTAFSVLKRTGTAVSNTVRVNTIELEHLCSELLLQHSVAWMKQKVCTLQLLSDSSRTAPYCWRQFCNFFGVFPERLGREKGRLGEVAGHGRLSEERMKKGCRVRAMRRCLFMLESEISISKNFSALENMKTSRTNQYTSGIAQFQNERTFPTPAALWKLDRFLETVLPVLLSRIPPNTRSTALKVQNKSRLTWPLPHMKQEYFVAIGGLQSIFQGTVHSMWYAIRENILYKR